MSYFIYNMMCEDCNATWACTGGMVGMTSMGSAPDKCPQCSSAKIKNPNLPKFDPPSNQLNK